MKLCLRRSSIPVAHRHVDRFFRRQPSTASPAESGGRRRRRRRRRHNQDTLARLQRQLSEIPFGLFATLRIFAVYDLVAGNWKAWLSARPLALC